MLITSKSKISRLPPNDVSAPVRSCRAGLRMGNRGVSQQAFILYLVFSHEESQ